jgi:nicotinate dehydrogenase subunit A
MTAPIHFTLNGAPCAPAADPSARLLDVLREDLGLVATRFGCGLGQCGSCHVLVDGRALPACDTPLWAVADRAVVTVEGHGDLPVGRALRAAFAAEQALQCGWCTSGMLAGAAALLLRVPAPTEAQVREALDGHLCRCGAQLRIVRAVLRAARALAGDRAGAPA